MKREVASSLVERGVAERVRLTQAYEKNKTELQKQHDIVKTQLNDHKEKVSKNNQHHFPIAKTVSNQTIKLLLEIKFILFFFHHRPECCLKKIVNHGRAFHRKDF